MGKARLPNKYPLRKGEVKLKKLPKNLCFSDHVALLGDADLDQRGQRKAVREDLAKALTIMAHVVHSISEVLTALGVQFCSGETVIGGWECAVDRLD